MQIKLTSRELATVLASLRYWQECVMQSAHSAKRGHRHFETQYPLTTDDIDELCERLKLGEHNRHA